MLGRLVAELLLQRPDLRLCRFDGCLRRQDLGAGGVELLLQLGAGGAQRGFALLCVRQRLQRGRVLLAQMVGLVADLFQTGLAFAKLLGEVCPLAFPSRSLFLEALNVRPGLLVSRAQGVQLSANLFDLLPLVIALAVKLGFALLRRLGECLLLLPQVIRLVGELGNPGIAFGHRGFERADRLLPPSLVFLMAGIDLGEKPLVLLHRGLEPSLHVGVQRRGSVAFGHHRGELPGQLLVLHPQRAARVVELAPVGFLSFLGRGLEELAFLRARVTYRFQLLFDLLAALVAGEPIGLDTAEALAQGGDLLPRQYRLRLLLFESSRQVVPRFDQLGLTLGGGLLPQAQLFGVRRSRGRQLAVDLLPALLLGCLPRGELLQAGVRLLALTHLLLTQLIERLGQVVLAAA